ncbi:hypothetical protein ABBQ38_009887 [Trebouxia sp. C0009 RCD-2024]
MLGALLQGAGYRSLLNLSYVPRSATQLVSLQQANYAKEAAKPSRAVTPNKTGKKTKEMGTNDNKIQRFLLALAPQEIADLKLSDEEKADAAARSRDYSRRKMAQHREWQKDITQKIKLREAAIAALPEELRAAARAPDYEPFPANRQMWTLTPPIPGFQEQQETATAAKFAKGSRRR